MRGEFRLQGYELEGLLSAGATGEVWLARAAISGDEVALKRVRPRTAEARDELRRLVSLLALLDHPHLLTVHEGLPYGDEMVLVVDRAEGGSLDQLLRGRGALDPGEVVTAVAPAAEALAAAHERGLVHGDVTPEAILFTPDGRPLVSDVGLLGLVEGGESVHADSYVDPTGSAGSGAPSPPGDVYALAAVTYEAATGLPALPGQPRQPMPQVVPGAPVGLVHAVEAGLQAVPARRPTAAQFADLLYAACEPRPVRFPVGLVLSDADLAAAMARRAAAGATPGLPADPPHHQDPFVQGLGAAGLPEPASRPGAPDADLDDDAADERRRRIMLSGVGGAMLLLVAGAVVGGIAWANRSEPARPPVARVGDNPATERPRGEPSHAPDARRGSGSGGAGPAAPTRPASSPTARPPGETPQSAQPSAPPGPEARWTGVLTELDQHRARAFAAPDPGPLAEVYTPGSDLLELDRAEVAKCVDGGWRLEGLRFDIKSVRVVADDSDRVVLRVVDQLQAYTVVEEDGRETNVSAGEVKTRAVTLRRSTGSTWLIDRVEDA